MRITTLGKRLARLEKNSPTGVLYPVLMPEGMGVKTALEELNIELKASDVVWPQVGPSDHVDNPWLLMA